MDIDLINSTLVHKVLASSDLGKDRNPALILLHGRGSDEDDLLGLTPYLDPRFFIVSARAPFPFPHGGYSWYAVTESSSPVDTELEESYCRLAQFIEDVKTNYPVDAARVFLLGFSMGSVMSFAVSLTKPDSVVGVVAHSGYIPENTSLRFRWDGLAGLSIFVAHGAHDPIVSIQHGRRANELLKKTKARLTYREYPIAHNMSEESLFDVSVWLQSKLELAGDNRSASHAPVKNQPL